MGKLLQAIPGNSHLCELRLTDSNLQGGRQAKLLAEALVPNTSLRVLDVSMNLLSPVDLQHMFQAIGQNNGLEELKCSNQFVDQPLTRETYAALGVALKTNMTVRKLGLQLTDAHWRDQINRGLVKNGEHRRIRRKEEIQQRQAEEIRFRGADGKCEFYECANFNKELIEEASQKTKQQG